MPESVAGFRLLRKLGSGGMGAVYEAESSGRRVALKLIAAEAAASPEAVERFRQEGRLASSISHPRCVFVLAADEDEGRPYIVMELMPGSTLKDLVAKHGPLPPARAIALVLDVLDGLEEAHQHGVIHRDVKPSNCFLQADGGVKVGDFGLSKSLAGDAQLTRTGAFVGTPLFASPEQVRGEPLDPRTDVYSLSATLYYLLVGRAPFQGGDAASTLARLAADAAPPMRTLRPEISPALDRVVLRGLERERERRWQSMDELRAALLPFLPGRLSIGGMGIRLGAYLLDHLVLVPLNWIIVVTVIGLGIRPNPLDDVTPWVEPTGELSMLMGLLTSVVYFGVLEGLWGWSVGKWCLRLRVCGEGQERPGLVKGFARALIFVTILNVPSHLFGAIWDNQAVTRNPALLLLAPLFFAAGVGLILSTMRQRNGYRGPHELLSGTRVVQLPWARKRKLFQQQTRDVPLGQAKDLPERLGPFAILGMLRRASTETILLGEDRSLSRHAWLWLRPAAAPDVPAARREVNRVTRLRWLAAGLENDLQWDAFLAPTGCALRDTVAGVGRLTWSEARPLLEELASELAAAIADDTLPANPGLDHIYVQARGRIQLIDFAPRETATVTATGTTPQQVSLSLLGQIAALVLEGQPRGDAAATPLRAPLPKHVNRFVHRLYGLPRPYESVGQFQKDLDATCNRPTEVSAIRRLGHLAILTVLLAMGWGCCLFPMLLSPRVVYVGLLDKQIRDIDRTLPALETQANLDLAVSLLQPDFPSRWQGIGQWLADLERKNRLRDKLPVLNEQLHAWRASLSWLEGKLVEAIHQRDKLSAATPAQARANADSLLAADARGEVTTTPLVTIASIILGIGPVLWIIWAFLTRGGFSHGLAGIMLVRSDGQRAARWQCAWRSFLFWLPISALILASMFLDLWFWSLNDPAPAGPAAWLPWLASVAWLMGLLLLPVYAVMALRSPARSLHDRLAGTWLAPL